MFRFVASWFDHDHLYRPRSPTGACRHGSSCIGRGSSHERYFVVEAWWMSTWRAFHDNSSILSDPPGCLLNQAFRCDHGLVVVGERLRQLVERGQLPPAAGAVGASVLSAMSDEDGVPEAEVITETEWLDLHRVGYVTHVDGGDGGDGDGGDGDGGGDGGGGSSSAGGAASSTSTSTAKSVLERTFGVRYSPGEEEEEGGGWFPTVCEECTKAAAERAKLSKIVFEGKQVKVIRLKDGDEAPTGDGAAAQFSSTGRLKRNTRGRGAAPFEITCGSDDTVSHLKLQVFASIEVAPARQVLYLRGTELTGGSTLQAANVKAGDTLHLKVTEPCGDVDEDDGQIFLDGLTKTPSGPETGFQGTALMGGGGGGGSSSSGTRRPSPPAFLSGVGGGGATVDVEAEIAAAEAASLAVDDWEESGAIEGASEGFMACSKCTLRNKLTAERCLTCNEPLFT
ncbi:unnamed protein product [Ectocarpus sp. 4 AP-2014]